MQTASDLGASEKAVELRFSGNAKSITLKTENCETKVRENVSALRNDSTVQMRREE